jgi:hypothetical protein
MKFITEVDHNSTQATCIMRETLCVSLQLQTWRLREILRLCGKEIIMHSVYFGKLLDLLH